MHYKKLRTIQTQVFWYINPKNSKKWKYIHVEACRTDFSNSISILIKMQWKVEWFFYKKVPPKIDQSYVTFSVNNHPKWTKLSKKITKENKCQDLLLFEKVCPARFYMYIFSIFWVFWIYILKTWVCIVRSFL